MTEEEKAYRVCNAESFDELKKIFDEIGEVKGSQKSYSPERLKEKIDQINSHTPAGGRGYLQLITRTYGIRAKVAELFYYAENERIARSSRRNPIQNIIDLLPTGP